jgi:4'-phosphopantetheinyl transferase
VLLAALGWRPPAPGMTPGNAVARDDIDVWTVGLDAPPAEREALAETLSAEERQRAARFHFDRDRERFTAARGSLRRLLGSYCGRPPRELVFTYGQRGKPALADKDGEDLRFNLAHASGRALIAVTRGREVGVDLEDLQRAGDWQRLARRFFAPCPWTLHSLRPVPGFIAALAVFGPGGRLRRLAAEK